MSVIPEYGLTGEQLDLLMRPLNGNRVQEHKGQAHLEAWDVRRWLTRVFGFAGWSDTILACDLVHETVWPWTDAKGEPVPGKNRATVVYRVTLRLVVKDVHGREINHWDDVATGEAVNQASVGDAHDLAVKAAVSQALKRCAVNLGDQFGLSLYNDGGIAPVIVRTVGHPNVPKPGADAPAVEDAPVVGGELAEQAAPEQPQQPAAPVVEMTEVQMISDGQRKAVFALLTQKHGKVPDSERYAGLSKFAGRTVTSLNDYTYAEAAALLDALAKQPDHKPQPAQADPNANFHEAEKLAQLPQSDAAEQLEEDLRDAVESSDNRFEVAAAMKMAADARDAGKLTAEQYTRLTEAANLRVRQGSRQLAGVAA